MLETVFSRKIFIYFGYTYLILFNVVIPTPLHINLVDSLLFEIMILGSIDDLFELADLLV